MLIRGQLICVIMADILILINNKIVIEISTDVLFLNGHNTNAKYNFFSVNDQWEFSMVK